MEMDGSGRNPVYRCRNCLNPLALHDDLQSKNYKARSGQAYLFRQARNIVVGEKVERQLITGRYSIAHIFCSRCGEDMGWTYVTAFDPRERYKEGKYILEKTKLVEEC